MPFIVLVYFLLKGLSYAGPSFEPGTKTLATINHSLSGCFSYSSDSLVLYQQGYSYFATLATNNKNIQTLVLTKEQVAGIFSFIEDCKNRQAKVGMCTTVEVYRIQTGDQQFMLTDGTCTWRGFDKLQKVILPADSFK